MPTRQAEATWKGDLKKGTGQMSFGQGAYEGAFSYKSRFENGTGTNPEELIGAALSGCYSMALSAALAKAGAKPDSVRAKAEVTLSPDKGITTISLNVKGKVADMDENTFKEHAQKAKESCPVANALSGVNIQLNAELNN